MLSLPHLDSERFTLASSKGIRNNATINSPRRLIFNPVPQRLSMFDVMGGRERCPCVQKSLLPPLRYQSLREYSPFDLDGDNPWLLFPC